MDQKDWQALKADVKIAEGFRKRAYKDSVGVWTIGYGTNLQELKIDESLAAKWLEAKLLEAEQECERAWDWFPSLSTARKRALIELVYNMGITRFSKFVNTIDALAKQDWVRAANGLANSKWALQVGPTRANRIITMVQDGTAPSI